VWGLKRADGGMLWAYGAIRSGVMACIGGKGKAYCSDLEAFGLLVCRCVGTCVSGSNAA
jgi:hypothetical protein